VTRITTHSHPQRRGEILTVTETPDATTVTHVDRGGHRTPVDTTPGQALEQGWRPEFRRDAD